MASNKTKKKRSGLDWAGIAALLTALATLLGVILKYCSTQPSPTQPSPTQSSPTQSSPTQSSPTQSNDNQASQRQVTVSGTIDITDDETWPIIDEREEFPVYETMAIGVGSSSSVEIEECAGDEVRVILKLYAQEADRNTALIKGTATLYEGTNCATNDLEQEKKIQLKVPAASNISHNINLVSSGVGGGDTAKITLNFDYSDAQ